MHRRKVFDSQRLFKSVMENDRDLPRLNKCIFNFQRVKLNQPRGWRELAGFQPELLSEIFLIFHN
jgi:hypothetical protein